MEKLICQVENLQLSDSVSDSDFDSDSDTVEVEDVACGPDVPYADNVEMEDVSCGPDVAYTRQWICAGQSCATPLIGATQSRLLKGEFFCLKCWTTAILSKETH